MTLFGEFLITLGLVKESAVLDALVAQAASGLSLCQAVHQGQLLTPAQQLQIFTYQAQNKVDYLQAAVATGLWTQNVEHRAMEMIHRHRKPLGHFLLTSGSIGFAELIKALDEYVVQNPDVPEPILLRPTAVTASKSFDFPVFGEDVLIEFLQTFRREQLGAYESTLANFSMGQSPVDNDVLKKIREGCLRIRSSARLMRAELTETLSNYLCEYFDNRANAIGENEARMLTDCIRELSYLRDFIERDLTEKSYFESPDRRQSFDSCCERLRPQQSRKRKTAS